MTKKNIVLSVIMGVAITLLLTSTNLAQADPTGDTVFIIVDGIPVGPEQTVEAVVGPGPEAFFDLFGDPEFLLTVDIDDGAVWIEMPFGSIIPIPFSVHIEDIDWIDDGVEVQGEIVEVSCEEFILGDLNGPVLVDWDTNEEGSAIWILVQPLSIPGIPTSIHCEYSVVHIGPPIVFVDIDIKPGSDPSSVNCKNLKGNVPVAIFGSDTFDVIDIEIVSMNLVGLEPIQVFEVHGELHIDDLNDDGFDDAVLHLDKAEVCEATETAPLKETVEVELSGETTDGTEFVGTGDIKIVKR